MSERMTDEQISDAIITANESEFGDTLVVLELLAVVAQLLKDCRSTNMLKDTVAKLQEERDYYKNLSEDYECLGSAACEQLREKLRAAKLKETTMTETEQMNTKKRM